MYYLERVNFTTSFGDPVSFDENGDALPIYDVMNWLWLPNGQTKVQNVGEVKKLSFSGEQLTLDEDNIFWNFKSKKVISFLFSVIACEATFKRTMFLCFPYSHLGQCAATNVFQVRVW